MGIDWIETQKLLNAYRLRPANHSGKEITLLVVVGNRPFSVNPEMAEIMDLKVGDGIRRHFTLPALGKREYVNIYGDGEMADWLEKVEKSSYHKVRLKFISGITKDVIWTEDEQVIEENLVHGFKLLEILEEYLDEYVLEPPDY